MNVRASDRRRSPWFGVDKPDLARLAEVCEVRQLAYARSVYFAVLETANDQRSQDEARATHGELAQRAGVSVSTLKKCVAVLTEAGLLEVQSGRLRGEPNVWFLLSEDEGGVGVPRLPGSRATATGVGVPRLGGRRTTATPMETSQENSKENSQEGSPTDSVTEVWEHYQATRPNGKRCKFGMIERNLIRDALKVKDVAECKLAITGLFRSDYHLNGGYIHIKYALRGGGQSPTPAATIDRLMALAVNGNGGDGHRPVGILEQKVWYDGRTWHDLTRAEQENAKDLLSRGGRPWEANPDADAPPAPRRSNGNGRTLNAANILDDD